jgi:hypothetical protein
MASVGFGAAGALQRSAANRPTRFRPPKRRAVPPDPRAFGVSLVDLAGEYLEIIESRTLRKFHVSEQFPLAIVELMPQTRPSRTALPVVRFRSWRLTQ